MINYIHSLLHRPEKGWDPIPAAYAEEYSHLQWNLGVNESLLDELEAWLGGFGGKQVLDLGGGPGHYSVAFAKRNADVTWHDVSTEYKKIAQQRAAAEDVRITFSLGYLEDAVRLHSRPFDLVFNRVCWCYGADDQRFADTIFDLVKPGGSAYIDTQHSRSPSADGSWSVKARAWLNDRLAFKIGHPAPPHGRVAELFMKKPIAKILVDYSSPTNDRVLFSKR
jgi:2-polyprenyl-3-methyl-5-hydroxy-6-metoxy-1,4-benzoquinol methylase